MAFYGIAAAIRWHNPLDSETAILHQTIEQHNYRSTPFLLLDELKTHTHTKINIFIGFSVFRR
jgi:hypothetical protein